MEGWQLKRLDEIGGIYSGSTPSTAKSSFWSGGVIWVTPNDLSQLNTPYLSTSGKKITLEGLKSCSSHLLPSGSIILSSRAPIGYIAISKVEFCTNQGCKSFKLKEQYNSEFVYYNLNFNVNKIKTIGEGTTFAEISKTALGKVEMFFLENKKEQEKIAEVLSTIDRAIAQTEAIIAKQQRIKTGLMQDLLTKGIDKNSNIRSEATHEFKDSAIGRIPVEWEVENFIDACERVSVGIATSTTKYFQSEGVPLLRNQNILSGVFDLNELLYISLDFDVINKSKRLKTGDLVTMRTGYPGRTAVTTSFMDGWQTFTTLISTPKKQKYRPDFLSVLMNSFVCRKQILTLQGGGAQQNLNVGWLIKMKVFKPSIAEQTGILSVLNDIDKAIDCNSKQLQKLHHQKTGLMQDLLTGKVRVTNLLNQKAAAN